MDCEVVLGWNFSYNSCPMSIKRKTTQNNDPEQAKHENHTKNYG
jgi:hypothetical protein